MSFSKTSLIQHKTSKVMLRGIRTFAFLDSETTGLPQLENYKTKITELCIVVVHTSHLSLGVFPRVQNKLSLCFNPGKYIDKTVSNLTGLDNFLLENQSRFQSSTVKIINEFLDAQEKPVCLVAHNGNRFDYPILKTEVHNAGESLPEHLLCVDSLEAFKCLHASSKKAEDGEQYETLPIELQDGYDELLCSIVDEIEAECVEKPQKKSVEEIKRINETTPKKKCSEVGEASRSHKNVRARRKIIRKFDAGQESFKLEKVYERLTSKEKLDSHKAEADVNMLISCAATYGDAFVDWANKNAKPLLEVPLMEIGRKLGS